MRQRAGSRQGDKSTGGWFASKTAPSVNDTDQVGFNTEPGAARRNWDSRTVKLWGLKTTFSRTVEHSRDGEDVVVVTSDCDPPDLVLLAKKGDPKYWNGDTWSKDHKTRRVWCADIARQMLEAGLVATDNTIGIRDVMLAAGSRTHRRNVAEHTLSAAVAQIRGLRMLQSMAPTTGWVTSFGGCVLPRMSFAVLQHLFDDVLEVYERLLQPPWEPDGVAWGPQPVAGHATTIDGAPMFVGEHSDLLWRALTETDGHGMSPLKHALISTHGDNHPAKQRMLVAAVLHDDTAASMLTTDLFEGLQPSHQSAAQLTARQSTARREVLAAFNVALNAGTGHKHWTVEQQTRIRGLIDVVEASNP